MMARYKKRFKFSRSKPKYGKVFRTRKGKIGSYKYVNGRRVAFVAKRKAPYRRKRSYSRGRRY